MGKQEQRDCRKRRGGRPQQQQHGPKKAPLKMGGAGKQKRGVSGGGGGGGGGQRGGAAGAVAAGKHASSGARKCAKNVQEAVASLRQQFGSDGLRCLLSRDEALLSEAGVQVSQTPQQQQQQPPPLASSPQQQPPIGQRQQSTSPQHVPGQPAGSGADMQAVLASLAAM